MALQMPCGIGECTFVASHDDKDILLALFSNHEKHHDYQANVATAPQQKEPSRAPKLERPKISVCGSEETWNNFILRWNNYKRTSGIPSNVMTGELFECCSTELGDDILREDNTILDGSAENLMTVMRKFAVIPVAKTVRRSEVLMMKQDHKEGIRSYFSRVKGKADTCAYLVKCIHGCNKDCDYTNEIIKDILVTGLSDPEIRRDVLGWHGLDGKSVQDTVTFIESKEMARNALAFSNGTATGSINSTSTYRKQQKTGKVNESKEKKLGRCPSCDKEYRLYKFFKNSNRFNEKPFSTCLDWHTKRRSTVASNEAETSGLFSSLGAIQEQSVRPDIDCLNDAFIAGLKNMTFDDILGWQRAKRPIHPDFD